MNKRSRKTTKSKKVKLSELEDEIDKIIVKNKDKLQKLHFQNINIEKFSLKNKDKNAVFYLRKKQKTKSDDSKDIGIKDEKSDYDKSQLESKKDENNKKDLFKSTSKPNTLRDLIDSKDFDMVVSDINRLIEKESKSDIDKKYEKKTDAGKKPFVVVSEISDGVKDIELTSQKDENLEINKKTKEDKFQSHNSPYKSDFLQNKKDKKKELKKLKNKSKIDGSWEKELKNGLDEDIFKDNIEDAILKSEVEEDKVSKDFIAVDDVEESITSNVSAFNSKVKQTNKKELKAREKELRAKERELKKARKKELKAHKKQLKNRKKELKLKNKKSKSFDKKFKSEIRETVSDGSLVVDDFKDVDIVQKVEEKPLVEVTEQTIVDSDTKEIKDDDKKDRKTKLNELRLKEKQLRSLSKKYGSRIEDKSLKEDYETIDTTEEDDTNKEMEDKVSDKDFVSGAEEIDEIEDVETSKDTKDKDTGNFVVVDEVKDSSDTSKIEYADKKAKLKEFRSKEKRLKSLKRKYGANIEDKTEKDDFIKIAEDVDTSEWQKERVSEENLTDEAKEIEEIEGIEFEEEIEDKVVDEVAEDFIEDVDVSGEVEDDVGEDLVVDDEVKDSGVSKVGFVGGRFKRAKKRDLKAREKELKAQEKELRLKEKRIKKDQDKKLRLEEKKAKKDKKKELRAKKKESKLLKKKPELKPDVKDVDVSEDKEVPIDKEIKKPEVSFNVEDVVGLEKKTTEDKKKKLEPKKEELEVEDKAVKAKHKKEKDSQVKVKSRGFFDLIKNLLKPKPKDKGITVIFGDVKVIDETEDLGDIKVERIDKKELKARKKELKAQRKEQLKSKKKKSSYSEVDSKKKGRYYFGRKEVLPRTKGKDVVGVSKKGLFFKRKKSGISGSALDGECLDKDVVGVSGDVVVADEIEDVGVVSEAKPRRGLRFGKKVGGFVSVDRKIIKAEKKKLRSEKKELKTKEKHIKTRDKGVSPKGIGLFSLGKKEHKPKPKGKNVVVSKKGLFFKRKKSGISGSALDGEGLDKDVVGVSGDVVVVDEVEDSGVSKSEEAVTGGILKRSKKKDLKPEEKSVSFKEDKVKTKGRFLGFGRKESIPKPKGKDIVGETKKGLFSKKKKSGIIGSSKEAKAVKKTTITPMFRIDHITHNEPVSQDEKKLLDDKIKIFAEKSKTDEKDEDGKSEAIKLATEHIKEKSTKVPKHLQTNKDIKKEETKGPTITTGEYVKDNYDEHIFFDEEENTGKGWSPKLTKTNEDDLISQGFQQSGMASESMNDLGYLELPEDVLRQDSAKLSDLGFSTNQWDELDFYSLYEPFAYVEILREKDTLDKCYFLIEIALTDEEEKTLAFIKETILNMSFNTDELEEKGYEKYLLEKLDQVIQEYNLLISEESRKKIFYYIGKSSLGLGKLDPLMKDPNIEDISCDGSNVPIFLYHRKFGSLKSNVHFNDEEELSSFVHRLAQKCGKQISIAEPMLDATMPDGSRIQMTLSDEITAKGSTFTIRKFRSDPFSPPDIVEFNTMSSEMVAYMWIAIENGINTLFAGGTASGKTTALNAVSLFIPRESKIVSIEETREINLPHPNWIPGVARSGFGEVVGGKVIGEIDLYDLMKAALRQRPEYILVGEIRGREAYVLFQAMATGHATYSTVHADSAQSLIHRLEGKPINIPRVMLQSLDVVCLHVITRVKNMRARRCKQIIEIIDIDPTTKEILTNEVFRWDPVEDKFVYSGKSYILERIRGSKDMTREDMTQEIKRREKIIEWMNKNNVREFRGVAKIVSQYAENPDEVMKKIEKDVKNNEK